MNRYSQKGVTLVELVISIVIMSIAMLALLSSFGVSIQQSAEPLWRTKTLKLAQLYLDEILAKRFDDTTLLGGVPAYPGAGCDTASEEGNDRTQFDDVGDYNGIADAVPVSLISPLDSSYDNYRVTITVECDGDSVDAENSLGVVANNQAKLITVAITAPNNKTMRFAAYKGNF